MKKVKRFNQTRVKTNNLFEILSKPLKNLLFLCLLLSSVSYGFDYEGGPFTVSKLRIGHGGVSIALDPAPKGCDGGSQYRMHLRVSKANQQEYDDMVAGLIAAHATGQKLQFIWYQGKGTCYKNHILTLKMFEYEAK